MMFFVRLFLVIRARISRRFRTLEVVRAKLVARIGQGGVEVFGPGSEHREVGLEVGHGALRCVRGVTVV